MWSSFASRNFDYLEQWHRRLTRGLVVALNAKGQEAEIQAGRSLGEDRTILMQRMFEEGVYAVSDILNAKCFSRSSKSKPGKLTLSEELKRIREQ